MRSKDLSVLFLAAVLFLVGYVANAALTRPVLETVTYRALVLKLPQGWLSTGSKGEGADAVPMRVWYRSLEDPLARLELRIEPKPRANVSLQAALDAQRAVRYGDLYARHASAPVTRPGGEWRRTEFSYAYKPNEYGAPALATGIEYATVVGDDLYVVTLHAPEDRVRALERQILQTAEIRTGDSS